MPSFTLAPPQSSFAAALPSTFLHVGLIVSAIWATRATAIAIADPPIEISIDWAVHPVRHAMSTTSTVAIPGAPSIEMPVIPDLPATDPFSDLPILPRIDPGATIPRTTAETLGLPGAETIPVAQIFRETEVDELPSLLTPGRLRYPAVLADAGIGGAVTLTFVIDAEGRVDPAAIEILSATHLGFVEAAKEAVATSRFRPARKHGSAVRVRVRQTITFKH